MGVVVREANLCQTPGAKSPRNKKEKKNSVINSKLEVPKCSLYKTQKNFPSRTLERNAQTLESLPVYNLPSSPDFLEGLK
jgi:hypothetical protein